MSKQVHVSHASCDHDKTSKARAVCRRIRRGGAPETSKAEIVARVKGAKKSNKRAKKAKAPVLRELLSLNAEIDMLEPGLSETLDTTYPNSVDNEDELPASRMTDAEAQEYRRLTLACEQDDVKGVQVNVIAKGSKVVHASTGSDDAMLFSCTKRPINVDSATITTNDVTCKNCLKITK